MNICIVIPTYNIHSHRLANFKFVVDQLVKQGVSDVFVIEQITDNKNIKTTTKFFPGVKYLPFEIDSGYFNKARLLNLFIKHTNYEYVWVLDVDVYLNYTSVLKTLSSDVEFVKPYSCIIKLTETETLNLINSGQITNNQQTVSGNNSFGKYSFIIKKSLYLGVGGMDERFRGWGFQDLDLVFRLPKKTSMDHTDNVAFHLYHTRPSRENYKKNQLLYKAKIYAGEPPTPKLKKKKNNLLDRS